ncbi:unnamed protein product [Paramecium octaurelia]|uniref:Uncharacterized protein n=1 Tax=Paramecium octaurelia TaxID=43137 RepID=A0A8S1YJR4_PAROT|nr:unnamed protein product [Paramecium octaurelia]
MVIKLQGRNASIGLIEQMQETLIKIGVDLQEIIYSMLPSGDTLNEVNKNQIKELETWCSQQQQILGLRMINYLIKLAH